MSYLALQASTDFGLTPSELRFVVVGPEWTDRFNAERLRIAKILGSAAADIQHIGSTAVSGITAKPILDIAVAISDVEFESIHTLQTAQARGTSSPIRFRRRPSCLETA